MTAGSHGFLGQEFLTWLWFRIETDGGEFTLSRERVVGVSMDDLLQFAPRDDEETSQVLKKGIPSRTAEARVSLQQGHRLAKARLAIACDQRVWSVTLDGATMSLGSVKLPEDDEEATSAEEKTEERVSNLLDLQEIAAELYGLFLRERLAPDYHATGAERQAQWMAG